MVGFLSGHGAENPECVPDVLLHVRAAVAEGAVDGRGVAQQPCDLEVPAAEVLELKPIQANPAHHGPPAVALVAQGDGVRVSVQHVDSLMQRSIEALDALVVVVGLHDGHERGLYWWPVLAQDAGVQAVHVVVEERLFDLGGVHCHRGK